MFVLVLGFLLCTSLSRRNQCLFTGIINVEIVLQAPFLIFLHRKSINHLVAIYYGGS